MRLSAKSRYALAAVTHMARQPNLNEYITVISISEKLGISKIYLEQVFSLLRRGGIVHSVKGAQGGYQLTRPPKEISVLDVLSTIEISLFEPAEDTVPETAPDIEEALRFVFQGLDEAIFQKLQEISVADLVAEADKHGEDFIMYYI
ncbi:MAG TPA: Rrf2 family transcriptional regulator [Clostridiales bacterium]|jgi:Rrf2 family protein|nr:Rrf2 family transcriptional regulator [Clostridiales bacterium]